MATKKITKREKFEMLLSIEAVRTNEMLVEFINHELELLAKKNGSSTGDRKPTARQIENEGIKSQILEFLAENELCTATEIAKGIGAESFNKVNSLIKQLKDACLIERVEEKRKAFFRLAQ